MNRKRLFVIGTLSLVIAAFVTLVAYKKFRPVIAGTSQLASVVVADTDLGVGSRIAPADLRVVEYPAGSLPDGLLTAITGSTRRLRGGCGACCQCDALPTNAGMFRGREPWRVGSGPGSARSRTTV